MELQASLGSDDAEVKPTPGDERVRREVLAIVDQVSKMDRLDDGLRLLATLAGEVLLERRVSKSTWVPLEERPKEIRVFLSETVRPLVFAVGPFVRAAEKEFPAGHAVAVEATPNLWIPTPVMVVIDHVRESQIVAAHIRIRLVPKL